MEPGSEFMSVFEHYGDPVVEVRMDDGEARIVDGNDDFETVFGVALDDSTDDDLDSHLSVTSGVSSQSPLADLLTSDTGGVQDYELETAEGSRPYRCSAMPRGEENRWLVLFTDLEGARPGEDERSTDSETGSDEKTSTEEQTSQDQFEALVEHSSDVISILDAGGSYTYQSPAAAEVLGYDPDEMVGESAFEYIHPDDRGDVVEAFVDAVDKPDQVLSLTYRMRHGDDDWQQVESIASNQLDNPAIEGFVLSTRDITGRAESERELQLITQVFSRVFRHNVRNRLNVIEGHAQMLRAHGNGESEESIDKIFETTEQLLEHSEKAQRIANLVTERHTHPIDLHLCIQDAVETARINHPSVTIDVDVDSVAVRAHPEFPEAVHELIRNALRHTPDDRDPHIEIWTESNEDDSVTLFVEDNAGGLSDSEIKVLEEAEETKLRHGSGVGLWLVKWLVDRSHGTLKITQAEEGSRVGVTLHLTDEDPADHAAVEETPG